MKLLSTSISSVIALGMIAGATHSAQALTWNDAGPTNTWSTLGGDTNWSPGGVTWVQGSTATFVGAGEAITIGSYLDIGAMDFTGATGTYNFNNTASHSIDITGGGITGGANTQIVTTNGDLNFTNSASAGDATITINGTGSMNFLNTSSAGTAVINNQAGFLVFDNTATAGSATINNSGPSTITFDGSSTGGTSAIANGGAIVLDFNSAPTVTLDSLKNSFGGSGGDVSMGSKTLALTELNLGPSMGQVLNFELNTPGTSGKISISGGVFTGAGTGAVSITLQDIDLPGAVGGLGTTYTLIDWSALNPGQLASYNTTNGIQLSDFTLATGTLPLSLAGAYLNIIDNNKLVLVAVPEPSSFIMPFAAALGMLWLRRRSNRAAV